jgi:hypothetical protein
LRQPPSIIPDDVKPVMRQNFFRFFDEPDLPIARSQLRLLVTLARIDYPRAWPTLLADLSGPLQSSFLYVSNSNPTADVDERNRQKTILLNSLWAWNAFVKEWRSVKVPTGLKLMMDVRYLVFATQACSHRHTHLPVSLSPSCSTTFVGQ